MCWKAKKSVSTKLCHELHWIQIMADLWFWKNTLQCWAKYSWAVSKGCGIKWAVHSAAAAKIFRTWVHGTEQCCSTPWPSSSEGTGGSSEESHQLMLMEMDCFAVPLTATTCTRSSSLCCSGVQVPLELVWVPTWHSPPMSQGHAKQSLKLLLGEVSLPFWWMVLITWWLYQHLTLEKILLLSNSWPVNYFASHVSDQYSETILKGVCNMDLIEVT